MNKSERQKREILSRYPGVRLERKGKSGYVAISPDGQRYPLGSFGSNQGADNARATKNFEAWCKRHSGVTA